MSFCTIRDNSRAMAAEFRRLSRNEVRLATAKASTFTGERIKKALQDEIRRVFDRPTPYAQNSLYLKPATVSSQTASVWIKDETSNGGIAPEKFLGPEIDGGKRPHTRFEKALIARGLMPSDMYAAPGRRAKIDRFGNISRGQLLQILSALGATENTAGYLANRTAASRKRRRGKQADYFVGRPGNGSGPLGVWQRIGSGARPIIVFVMAPTYRKRLRFEEVAERVTRQEYPRQLDARLRSALARRG